LAVSASCTETFANLHQTLSDVSALIADGGHESNPS